MAGGSAIRGSRVGAGPMGEAERGDAAPAAVRLLLLCARPRDPSGFRRGRAGPGDLGLPALRSAGEPRLANPPPPPKIEPYKTHLAYVKERRSDAEAADILTEALQALRDRRAAGEVIY